MINSKIIASLAGWNSSVRSCRENALKFYYSYVGYKADVGEMEVVQYCVANRNEIITHIEGFIGKPNVNASKFTRAAGKPAKRKQLLSAQRKEALTLTLPTS